MRLIDDGSECNFFDKVVVGHPDALPQRDPALGQRATAAR
jgi:hypothetical protein